MEDSSTVRSMEENTRETVALFVLNCCNTACSIADYTVSTDALGRNESNDVIKTHVLVRCTKPQGPSPESKPCQGTQQRTISELLYPWPQALPCAQC